jgi:hypothetical protein
MNHTLKHVNEKKNSYVRQRQHKKNPKQSNLGWNGDSFILN